MGPGDEGPRGYEAESSLPSYLILETPESPRGAPFNPWAH
jgi:hypothetical protein